MKRMLALALCAVLMAGALAACNKDKNKPETTLEPNSFTSGEDAPPVSVNIPAGWIAFGSIDEDNNVTVHGLSYLRSVADETVVVSEQSVVTANVTALDDSGSVTSVTVDGKAIPVLIDDSGGVSILYAEQGEPGEDATTIDLGTLNNSSSLQTAASPGTTKATTKPVTTTKPLATAAPVSTTKKPTGTTDLYEKEKNDIINSNMSAQEKRQALNLLSYKMDENGIFYVDHEPWQKQFGFNQIYDLASPLIQLVYGTIRIKFRYGYVYKLGTEGAEKGKVLYDDSGNPIYETGANGKPVEKDWMIQLWKGRYGLVMLGAEFGVYTKPSTQQTQHYNAAVSEEELVMAMDVYQHNFLTKQTKYLFTRGPESAWWLTGFVPGSFYEYNKKSEIIAVANIQFPSEDMMKLFYNAMKNVGFRDGSPGRDNPETITTNGNSVKFCWQYIDQG